MIATFLVVFAGLAACQVLLAVKLADWLSPAAGTTAGSGSASPAGAGDAVALA